MGEGGGFNDACELDRVEGGNSKTFEKYTIPFNLKY